MGPIETDASIPPVESGFSGRFGPEILLDFYFAGTLSFAFTGAFERLDPVVDHPPQAAQKGDLRLPKLIDGFPRKIKYQIEQRTDRAG